MPDNDSKSGGSGITVRTGLLTAVITSVSTVERLRQEISQVRNEKASLANEVSQLQADNYSLRWELQCLKEGRKDFSLFPKLPAELRGSIWEFALMAPQTFISWEDDAENLCKSSMTHSRINIIMQTCQEAKAKALSLRFPWFQLREVWSPTGVSKLPRNTTKYWLYPPSTTIWIPNTNCFIPGDLDFHCGTCGRDALSLNGCAHSQPLKCLAVSERKWEDPYLAVHNDPEILRMGSAEATWYYGRVREVLIVIDNASNGNFRDIAFTTPSMTPHQLNRYFRLNLFRPERPQYAATASWEDLAKTKTETLAKFKIERTEFRKMRIDEGWNEADLSTSFDNFDVSAWEIPSVRYVEARSLKRDWISN